MSDKTPSSPVPIGNRRLRRAENLLSSTGQLVVRELDSDDSSFSPPPQSAVSTSLPTPRLSVSASIKKAVRNASNSITRSHSVRTAKSDLNGSGSGIGGDGRIRKGHTRSVSYAHRPVAPAMIHSTSAPSVLSTNGRSVQSGMRGLPTVLETGQSHTEFAATGSQEVENDSVPPLLQSGVSMTKISNKKKKKAIFRLDADLGQIVWESKKRKIIPIECIKEIRSGSDGRYYREQFQLAQEYEDRWLTIVYILDGNYKTLHMIAPTKDVFTMWDTALRKLYAVRQQLMTGLGNIEIREALWEKQYWKDADQECDQQLSFDEVEKLCKRLNINSSREDLFGLFKQADRQHQNNLTFEDFRIFVKLLKSRPEIDRLYKKLRSKGSGLFDFATFEMFMREKQESTLTTSQLRDLFVKYSTKDTSPTPGSEQQPQPDGQSLLNPIMTVDSFTSFLLSPDNSAFTDQHEKVWQDMTRPLSEYYISSSHNTYLVGHQLVGESTIEGYIRALLHSCRSVELDIYDGDIEPMIFHGKTFTSKVSLRQVCQAIKNYGFVTSPYPIVISAEIHCSVPQQDMIAEIMTSVFGDCLVRSSTPEKVKMNHLPSPEDLKGKILLKAKNLNLLQEPTDSDVFLSDPSASSASASESETVVDAPEGFRSRGSDSETIKGVKGDLRRAGTTVLQRVKSVGRSYSSSPPMAQSPPRAIVRSPGILSRQTSDPDRGNKPKMSLGLVALLVYTIGVKYRGINKKEEYAPEHMFSLSENTANKMLREGMHDLIKHNRSHLVRIYPKGLRLNSTNYEPHRFWSAGAQLVALNWQTFDLGYMINHAMFQRNGRAGYVLKPAALRLPNKELLLKQTRHTLSLLIISAQQLPRPKDASGHEVFDKSVVDPYVEVSLHVPDWTSTGSTEYPFASNSANIEVTSPISINSSSPRRQVYRTNSVKNNGFNPVWEEKIHIPFTCIGEMEDLVFVRFIVKQGDKDDEEPLAIYCTSLGSLGRGYRHLPLHDSQLSQYLFSTLFVRVNVENTST